MSQPTPYSDRCACKCGCPHARAQNCHNLCQDCFLQWCLGSETHAPAVDNSYLATYGLGNIWGGWMISQAPHLVAEAPQALLRPDAPRRCPLCNQQMARRPGGWKCFNPWHQQPVVILEGPNLPRCPTIDALGVCLP